MLFKRGLLNLKAAMLEEKIIKECTCKNCKTPFVITDRDLVFYERMDVPPPLNCPNCRLSRRMQERNARTLYKRKCDATGENLISMYHANHVFPVYKSDYWWSDKWDALDYSVDFDFKKPFFEQFKTLSDKVPHPSAFITNGTLQNSEYTNCVGYLKNCYMVFEADYNENCYHSTRINHCTTVVDCLFCYGCEVCHECVDCQNCYNLRHSRDCISCIDSFFLYDCKSCKNCIGCINQRHKQYMIFNKQYTKEEYEEILKNLNLATNKNIENLKIQAQKLFITQPHKNLQQERNENSFGDHLYNSKNATFCYDAADFEDCKYCARMTLGVKDCMDYNTWGMGAELVYQCVACGDKIYNMKFCHTCTSDLHDCEYCAHCTASEHLFGCFGLKRKKYCIFNKQYTKEEYETIRTKIVEHMKKTGEWGEFFPESMCEFAYNETIAMDYFPLTKEGILAKGLKWVEKDKTYLPQTYDLPATIAETDDSILNEILACTQCGKNYRIVEPELKFYKQRNIPIPSLCPDCRHFRRIKSRNLKIFWDSTCTKCGIEIKTTYDPKSEYIVYCEECFNKLVI